MSRLIDWLILKISPRFIKNIAATIVGSITTFLITAMKLDPETVGNWGNATEALLIAIAGYLVALYLDLGKSKKEE